MRGLSSRGRALARPVAPTPIGVGARAGLSGGTRSASVSWGFARHVLEALPRPPSKGSAPFEILRQGTALDSARRRNRLAITGQFARPEPGITRRSSEPRERSDRIGYSEGDGRPSRRITRLSNHNLV